MMTWIYVVLLLLVIAVPIALGLYAWWQTRAAPPVATHDETESPPPDSPSVRPTSLAEPEVALRIEREQ